MSSGGKSGGAPVGGGGAPVGSGGSKGGSGGASGGKKGSKKGSKKSGAHGGHPPFGFSYGGYPHSFGGLGDAKTDAGMPVFGYKSKGPKSTKKVKFAPVEPEKVNIEYDPDLYDAVVEDTTITPVKGPDSMSLKSVKKQDPSIAQRVMGPAAKDKEQAKQKPKKADIMDKLERATKMKLVVNKLKNGEDHNEDLFKLDPTSHAIYKKQSQLYHATMYQASMAATHGGHGGYGGKSGWHGGKSGWHGT